MFIYSSSGLPASPRWRLGFPQHLVSAASRLGRRKKFSCLTTAKRMHPYLQERRRATRLPDDDLPPSGRATSLSPHLQPSVCRPTSLSCFSQRTIQSSETKVRIFIIHTRTQTYRWPLCACQHHTPTPPKTTRPGPSKPGKRKPPCKCGRRVCVLPPGQLVD